MRLFFPTAAKSAAAAPSALLSVAAHAVLIGVAVYGTGVNARALDDAITSRVYYLPPPDRIGMQVAQRERIQYVDVGGGDHAAPSAVPNGRPTSHRGGDAPQAGGQVAGGDVVEQAPQHAVTSDDSVYSILSVDESAVRTDESAAPVYPRELIDAGTEGVVVTRYVIDTTGHADPASLEILPGAHPLLVQSVRDVLPRMLFHPASVQGRKVRQQVTQNFAFRIVAVVPAPAAPAEHTRTNPVP